jgi:hypothetical protein
VVEEGSCIPTIGVRADEVCNKVLEEFASRVPNAGDDSAAAALYDPKLEESISTVKNDGIS